MTEQTMVGILLALLAGLCGVLGYFVKRALDDVELLKAENFKLQITNLTELQVEPLAKALKELQELNLEARLMTLKEYDVKILAEQLRKLTDANLEQQIATLREYRIREVVEDVEALKNARFEDKIRNLQEDAARDRKELTEKISKSAELLSSLSATVANLESLVSKHHHTDDSRRFDELRSEVKAALDELNQRSTEADVQLKLDVQKLDHELFLFRRAQGA